MVGWPKTGSTFPRKLDVSKVLRLATAMMERRLVVRKASPFLDFGEDWVGMPKRRDLTNEAILRAERTYHPPPKQWQPLDPIEWMETDANLRLLQISGVRVPVTAEEYRIARSVEMPLAQGGASAGFELRLELGEAERFNSVLERAKRIASNEYLLRLQRNVLGGIDAMIAAAETQVTADVLANAGLPLRPPTKPSPWGLPLAPDVATMTAAPPGYELLTGKTFDIKEQLKQLGARWSPADKGWFIPVHNMSEARELVRQGAGTGPKVEVYPCWECGLEFSAAEYVSRHGNLQEWWCGCGVTSPVKKRRPNFG